MSVRGAEGTQAAGSKDTERRAASGQRVHFEALVAVGEAKGGGFEAESVDVSPDGMRLRTAYLPEVGDKLICRFDGMGSEIVAEGEVIWCNPKARGGEFGLRFVDLDDKAAEAVRSMCDVLRGEGGEEEPPSAEALVPRGARVRLHIDGLGSPMKARVREAGAKEVEVGSNLEFLKVGRTLELEDVDHGQKREVTIDHVKVDVDPSTNVPQLVVALRYDKALGETKAPVKAALPANLPAKKNEAEAPNGSAKAARAGEGEAKGTEAKKGSSSSSSRARRDETPPPALERAEASDASDGEEKAKAETEAEGEGEGQPGVTTRAMAVGRSAFGKLGPALSGMSERARGAMAGIVAVAKKRRQKGAEAEAEAAPAARRTTSPPPGGALKSEGRRLVREDESAEVEEAQPAPPAKSPRRAAVMGSLLGLSVVLALFGASRLITSRSAAPAASADATLAATASVAALPAPAPEPAIAPGTPTANVPLFGATPLSTTEPVPGNPVLADSAAPAAPEPGANAQGAGEEDEDGAAASDASDAPVAKTWGQGSVSHPIVLKVKMDGPIDGISGAAGPMGFTVSVPGRRAMSSAESLSRKDKRIDSVNVINTSRGAEVTVQFKDGVPPYLAKVKGSRLEIALGTEGHKKVAKAKKKSKSGKSSKKKSGH